MPEQLHTALLLGAAADEKAAHYHEVIDDTKAVLQGEIKLMVRGANELSGVAVPYSSTRSR